MPFLAVKLLSVKLLLLIFFEDRSHRTLLTRFNLSFKVLYIIENELLLGCVDFASKSHKTLLDIQLFMVPLMASTEA